MKHVFGIFLSILPLMISAKTVVVSDLTRERSIPIEVNLSTSMKACTSEKRCHVAFISAGNRVPFTKYKFITESLNDLGYMTVAIDHELPNDPPLSKTGDLYQTRIENWERGAKTIDFLQQELALRFPAYDFSKLTLIGHSNGGDISTWLSNENKSNIYQLITLDHKRVTLPKNDEIRILSLRSPEYPTKSGVLPTIEEQNTYSSCIVEISASKHMDFTDYGVAAVQQKTIEIMSGFVNGKTCSFLRSKT
ncbi:alpha/beta hydrolase [Vibrio kasasachensis]|uniref:alpha/beta hydrolase n=1 Tax=Vibrio kasasachensis TaxID=2910248 RepID=UPI003D107D95